jgi:hypothetical protein
MSAPSLFVKGTHGPNYIDGSSSGLEGFVKMTYPEICYGYAVIAIAGFAETKISFNNEQDMLRVADMLHDLSEDLYKRGSQWTQFAETESNKVQGGRNE